MTGPPEIRVCASCGASWDGRGRRDPRERPGCPRCLGLGIMTDRQGCDWPPALFQGGWHVRWSETQLTWVWWHDMYDLRLFS